MYASQLTARFLEAPASETIAEIVGRANRYAEALSADGVGDALAKELGVEPGWLIRRGEVATPESVARAEEELGFELPPSYRRFLLEWGGLTFCNYWCDRTTPIDGLVETSRSVQADMLEVHETSPLVEAVSDNPRVVRFADFHNHTAEYVYLASFRDHRGEAPAFMWFHDDVFGGADDLAYVERVEEQTDAWLAAASRRSEVEGVVAADTELTRVVGAALELDRSQRETLAAVDSELGSRLATASGAELLTALHAIRGALKSKKLVARRDELIGGWRDDGQPGSAPLAKLLRDRPVAEAPKGFDTFEEWLADRVCRQIEWIDGVLAKLSG